MTRNPCCNGLFPSIFIKRSASSPLRAFREDDFTELANAEGIVLGGDKWESRDVDWAKPGGEPEIFRAVLPVASCATRYGDFCHMWEKAGSFAIGSFMVHEQYISILMNESLTPDGLSRRSFIKRSVVASVAVASMTIFSGLVNAEISPGGYNYMDRCERAGACHSQQGVYTCPGVVRGGYSGKILKTCVASCDSNYDVLSCV